MFLPLPGSLQGRIHTVARQVRRIHLLRSLSVLILTLSLLAGLALGVDHFLRESLPAAVRLLLLAGWGLVAGILTLTLLRSLFRKLDPAALAAAIERKYPELGERLTSSVELCQHADAGNGSPALIALLVQETEARTQPLNLGGVISARSTRWLTGLAVVALAGVFAPMALAPRQYGRLASRFFLPWQTLAPEADYRLAIDPGDTLAARGRPVTITALLTPRHDQILLPRTSSLLVTNADGSTTRHEMTVDGKDPNRYTAAFRLLGDATYRVEAGNTRSAPYRITAVTPVELAPDNPTITVTPPAYATGTLDVETLAGLVDVSALQHSTLAFRFQFTRPAVAARLEWQGENAEGKRRQTYALPLSDDKTTAELTLPVKENGSYRLVLEAEHGFHTERDGGTITARPDQPPAVLKYVGQEGVRSARVYDRLALEVRLADDIAVAGADLEYRVNDEKSIRQERFALDGGGTREAVARHLFALSGKVKPEDEVHYRIRYHDNFPKEFGGPHVGYYPPDGWLRLRIVAEGGSIKEQDILARRDAINKKIDEIQAELKQEQRRTLSVRRETREDDMLSIKNAETLRELRKQNQGVEKSLNELAREMSENPGEEKLAQQAQEIARKEMRQADEGLKDASENKTSSTDRDTRLRDTEEELSRAMAKLDRLRSANEQLAQDKVDQAKVETLADRQQQLAEKAAELANKHPVQDPEAKKLADQVRKEQDEVAQELKKLTETSPSLQKALEQARTEQTRQAAEKARDLAQAQRDLAKASDETEKGREAANLQALQRKQDELAQRARELAKESAQPARANFAKPLQPEDATRAAESLKNGESDKALQEQDRAAREMDRLARDLERGAEMAKDARTAARQLSRLEEELAKRTKAVDPTKGAEQLAELKREQEAIRRSAEALSVPPQSREAQAEKKKATEALAQAEKQLEEKRVPEALASMEKARQALNNLSQRLPNTEERRLQAREELAKLQREQEAIAKRAQEGKTGEAAKKQEELGKRLEKLDTPNAEERRERARDAAKQAEADLRNNRPEEIKKSQDATKREMERLAQKLANQTPADEKAAELARRQEELARKAGQEEMSPAKRDELRKEQKKLADETKALDAKESPRKQQEAADATRRAAEESAKANPNSKESRQAMADAAKKLEELAREMKGKEENAERPSNALANKDQAEAARKLAQEQRDLRDATGREAEKSRNERRADNAQRDNAAGKLANEQREIAKESAQLSRDVAREQGEKSGSAQRAEQANRTAGEASRNLDSGALEKAQQSGKQSADELRQLANELGKTPRGKASPKQGDTLEQTRRLAQRQEGVNKQLESMAGNPSAQRGQQQSRQEELTRRTQDLMRELDELGKTGEASPRQSAARDAARATRSAESAMQAARGQAKQGNQSSTQQQREQAARNLEQAARQAEQGSRAENNLSPPQQDAGRSIQEARGQMNQARQQMERNQAGQAGQAMQDAAKNLQRASEQLMQAMQPPATPPRDGAPGGGAADVRELPQELAPHAGKKWGELPGEVRTKIVQEMKARYGEDYARMIKLYFEQIADTKKRK